MTAEPSAAESVVRSPITLLRELQSGSLSAATLSKEARLACVEHLTLEGYSVGEIAEVLQASTRTIHRNRKQIRSSHAVERDPELVETMVGQLIQHAEQSVSKLRRIARERDCPHAARVEAEKGSWTICRELVESLQRLGHLPTAATEIKADLTHRNLEAPGFDSMQAEVMRLELVLEQSGGGDPDVREQLVELRTRVGQFSMSEQIEEIGNKIQTGGGVDVETDPRIGCGGDPQPDQHA